MVTKLTLDMFRKTQHRPLIVLGLMSGTSVDGIDIAALETDGEKLFKRKGGLSIPYTQDQQVFLKEAMAKARRLGLKAQDKNHQQWRTKLDNVIAEWHYEAILAFRRAYPEIVPDLIGFHGQTLDHRPAQSYSWQAGDAQKLAQLSALPVVGDFRRDDILAGGEGAPLAPIYHAALADSLQKRLEMPFEMPCLFLNIGGIANLTWIRNLDIRSEKDNIYAFDTGPGNALMDDWVRDLRPGYFFDKAGQGAKAGKIHDQILLGLMDNSFFDIVPPKSLDRYDFTHQALRGLSYQDGLATLAAFTVNSILEGLSFLPCLPKVCIVSGGGRQNRHLMNSLEDRLPCPVHTIEDMGIDGDLVEAEAFAHLAVRSIRNLPLSFPQTTGVKHPQTGGKFFIPNEI